MVRYLFVLALTSLMLIGSSESQELPDFPDYFTAGVETIAEDDGNVFQNVTRVSRCMTLTTLTQCEQPIAVCYKKGMECA